MVHVFVSSVIHAPVEQVWQLVKGFNCLPDWHPLIKESSIEDGHHQDTVGCIRNFTLVNGQNARERLLSLSNTDHSFSYSMLDTGMGMYDYISTFRLMPVTDNNTTYASWSADFTTAPGDDTVKKDMVETDVFLGGFKALKERFAG